MFVSEADFPDHIQIFHHAARGGGGGVGVHCWPRPSSCPARSAAASGSANERQRIAAEESAPGAGRTDAVTQRRVRERSSPAARSDMENAAADFSGRWRMKSSENFEELLKALGEFSSLQLYACAF